MKKLMIALVGASLLFGTAADAAKNDKSKSRFEKLELFNKVLFLVESQYYRDVDTEKLIQGAIRGMMNTLDPHSAFLDKEVFTKMQEDTKGEFGGLGIEVTQKDGVLIIITPIEDTPAFRAGLKAGDRIVEINHESTVGITLEEAVERMRGDLKAKIHLGIAREGEDKIKHFELKREIIKIKSVKSHLVDEKYALIRLVQFQKNSGDEVRKAIQRFRKQSENLSGVILDLRANPGGLLEEAVNVSSIFLKDGIVVSTEGRDPKQKEIRYVKKTGHKELDIPVVVLINGASASASEIVAGALQDSKRAIIMGTQSFGKGSVQTVAKIDDTQGVKLTIAQYMTPNGRKIQAVGIKPDITVTDFEGKWVSENKVEGRYIREKDLRNHLTATIETPEEEKARLIREKEERQMRKKRLADLKRKKKEGNQENDIFKKYNPDEDYQVMQAVKYLKGFKLFKTMVN